MKLVFVHIPKTGGKTLRGLLAGVFPDSRVMNDNRDMHVRQNVMNALGSSGYELKHIYRPGYECQDVIMGHFKKTKFRHLDCPMITWMRDPVERVISNYVQQMTKWDKARRVVPEYYEMVKDHGIMSYAKAWRNLMAWYVDGSIDDFLFVGICERFDESIGKLGKILGVEFPKKYKKGNVRRHKPEFDKKIKREIAKYQQKDYELYRQALERLDKC